MSPDVKEFYGNDIASAIKEACETLGIAQEHLNIEVVETGSKGIFGLIRKKAHIRVTVQDSEQEAEVRPKKTTKNKPARSKPGKKKVPETAPEPVPEPAVSQSTERSENDTNGNQEDEENGYDDDDNGREPIDLSQETLTIIREQLQCLLELMGCPSTITVEDVNGTAHCQVSTEHEETLTSQDGRTLDSLQYLLRKIISRKIPGRVQLIIDVGNYRERRQQQLRELALEYASQVKESGKTQVIPSLNPSERRIVHVALQDDQEIRSRSIGEGLFKKVLIYKPGKGRRGSGRRRPRGKYRKRGNSGPKNGQ